MYGVPQISHKKIESVLDIGVLGLVHNPSCLIQASQSKKVNWSENFGLKTQKNPKKNVAMKGSEWERERDTKAV